MNFGRNLADTRNVKLDELSQWHGSVLEVIMSFIPFLILNFSLPFFSKEFHVHGLFIICLANQQLGFSCCPW